MTTEKIVLARIGWSEYYGHLGIQGKLLGGGEWNVKQIGSESGNFFEIKGNLYGYVQPPGGRALNLERIDATAADRKEISDVLVIFFATHPMHGKQRIVGWYKKAKVKREYSERPKPGKDLYYFICPIGDAVLLPENDRIEIVPRNGKGMPGQSNVFYNREDDGSIRNAAWLEKILDYVVSYGGPNVLKGHIPESTKSHAKSPEIFPFRGEYTEPEAHINSLRRINQDNKEGGNYRSQIFILNPVPWYQGQPDETTLLHFLKSAFGEKIIKAISLVSFVMNENYLNRSGLKDRIEENTSGATNIRILVAPPEGASRSFVQQLVKHRDQRLISAKQFNPNGYAGGLMHTKLLILEANDADSYFAVIGSSNATTGGLSRNIEYNILVRITKGTGKSNDPLSWFNQQWENGESLDPNSFSAMTFEERTAMLTASPRNDELFQYQRQAVQELDAILRTKILQARANTGGNGGCMLVMPTGAGKTLTVMRWLFDSFYSKDKDIQVLWLSHRKELLDQAFQTAQNEKHRSSLSEVEIIPFYGYISTYREQMVDEGDLFFSGSRLAFNNLEELKKRSFDVIIIDEAHHASASTLEYNKLLAELTYKVVLGVTATPYRGQAEDTKNLAHFFNLDRSNAKSNTPDLAYAITREKLVHEPKLTGGKQLFSKRIDFKIPTGFSLTIDSDDEVGFQDVIQQFKNSKRNQLIAKTYGDLKTEHNLKSSVVFCVDCEHANQIAILINKSMGKGSAQAFHGGEIPSDASAISLEGQNRIASFDRMNIIQKFRSNQIPVLTTVQLITEGFDVPGVDSIFLARPTMSTVLMTQMIGRGLRGPAVGGTEQCLIVDFADQVVYHGKEHHRKIMVAAKVSGYSDDITIAEIREFEQIENQLEQ